MPFSPRDSMLLLALFTYRYLQTRQLSQLSGRSGQIIRRRMRELGKLGYVVHIERTIMKEKVYALNKRGWDWVAAELNTEAGKLPFSKKAARVETLFLRHTLFTNDVRISFDLATREHPHVALHRTIPEWEMIQPQKEKDWWETWKKMKPWEKFVLWERLTYKDGAKKKQVNFRPDCAFLLYPRSQGPKYCGAFFLEADRNTESIVGKIDDKYMGFHIYFQKGLYYDLFKAGLMRVLFVLENGNAEKRIRKMQSQLRVVADKLEDPEPVEGKVSPAAFLNCFRFADSRSLNEKTVIDEPIWLDWRGNKLSLFNPAKGN